MNIKLNPSAAVQSGLTLITSLTCVDAVRIIPDYLSGRVEPNVFWVKVMIAVIMICIVLIIMFRAETGLSLHLLDNEPPVDSKNADADVSQ